LQNSATSLTKRKQQFFSSSSYLERMLAMLFKLQDCVDREPKLNPFRKTASLLTSGVDTGALTEVVDTVGVNARLP
jgi:hypothetical protein